MKTQQRLNKVLESVRNGIQEEVGSLMGVDFKLSDLFYKLMKKEEYFELATGKKIVAKVDVTGEIEGYGALIVDVKDAIRLGGTLIMLPPAELDEVVRSENYTEETEDSYGEIANIISGVYTKTFEDSYPKNCRFVRKEQAITIPLKVDISSDEPIPDQWYYLVQSGMVMDGLEMGDIEMLLPAEAFGFEIPAQDTHQPEEKSVEQAVPSPIQKPQEQVPVQETVSEEIGSAAESKKESVSRKTDINIEKHKKLVDKLLKTCQATISKEVGALLGVDVKLHSQDNRIVTKEEFFLEEATGKQILARMDVVDGAEGKSFLFVGLKDAIRIGSILIMLPPAELESSVAEETFSADTEDAYGEIANIISGVYTSVFKDEYIESLRFIKTEIEKVAPMKVDCDSDDVIDNQAYYMSSNSVEIDGKSLGNMSMLFPADLLRLEQLIKSGQADETVHLESAAAQRDIQKDPIQETVSEETGRTDGSKKEPVSQKTDINIEKHKKLVDKLLKSCQTTITKEVGALLGVDVKLHSQDNRIVTKEEFFLEEASGKQILARMDVVDGAEGKSFLFVSLKDAIRIGSILIMLPPAELEASVNEEEFSADTEDAYGEIANIIAGVYTSVFKEEYTKSLRFIKTEIEKVAPMKVDCDSDDVIVNQAYYMNSNSVEIDGKSLGNMNMLFPVDLLNLEQLIKSGQADEAVLAESVAAPGGEPAISNSYSQNDDYQSGVGSVAPGTNRASEDVEILLIENNAQEAAKIIQELTNKGITSKSISFRDNINFHITSSLKLVFIIMQEVNEQAYGVTIKVNTMCNVPIIAAAPGWTRSKVIKAVKYGINDILLTPASKEEIQEKIETNMFKMAA